MSNNFLNVFIDKPVRESAGSRSSNRFDYQKNWSLCELLDLHTSNEDYLMVFEHHEDVVVFNSQSTPSEAIFYQVKTKTSGNWTIGALTKAKKTDKSQSILEKLYLNQIHFSDNVNGLVFTSNQGLSTKLKNNQKSINQDKVSFIELSEKDKKIIHSAVELDGQKYCDLVGLKKIQIEKNDLRLSDHSAITKGKLVEFFEKLYPESEVNVSLVYKTFFDEIKRKTNYEKPVNSSNELYDNKGICRSSFEKMIGTVLQRRNNNELWNDTNQFLISEGYTFIEIKKIRIHWQQYIVDRMDVGNEFHIQFRYEISAEINKLSKDYKTFSSLKNEIIKGIMGNYVNDYSEDYVQAAILYEAMSDDPIPKVNQKFAEEEK